MSLKPKYIFSDTSVSQPLFMPFDFSFDILLFHGIPMHGISFFIGHNNAQQLIIVITCLYIEVVSSDLTL